MTTIQTTRNEKGLPSNSKPWLTVAWTDRQREREREREQDRPSNTSNSGEFAGLVVSILIRLSHSGCCERGTDRSCQGRSLRPFYHSHATWRGCLALSRCLCRSSRPEVALHMSETSRYGKALRTLGRDGARSQGRHDAEIRSRSSLERRLRSGRNWPYYERNNVCY